MKKKGQEEIVGFALIMILTAVVLLVFLGISLNSPQKDAVESYEAESFLQTALQYTTECEDRFGPQNVKELIFACSDEEQCTNGEESCVALESTIEGILEESWSLDEGSSIKGYEFEIIAGEEEDIEFITEIREGNVTATSRGASQPFSKSGTNFEVIFKVYS